MISEAYQRVATLQIGSNYCSFIAIFAALSLQQYRIADHGRDKS